jgi:hypothetical protein
MFEYKRAGDKGESPLRRSRGRLAGDRKLSRHIPFGGKTFQNVARQFPVLRYSASKKDTLCKSPAKSHYAPNHRENALTGVASLGKNSGLPLHPLPLFRKKEKVIYFSAVASLDNQEC